MLLPREWELACLWRMRSSWCEAWGGSKDFVTLLPLSVAVLVCEGMPSCGPVSSKTPLRSAGQAGC